MSNVIAFPGCSVPEPDPVPDTDKFAEWWENEALPIHAEVEVLMCTRTEAEFWSTARAIRERVNSWPIPAPDDD